MMNFRSPHLIFAAYLFLATVSAWSLDIAGGRIKLVLHEDTGKFSLYYLSDPEKKKYTTFFVDQDIRTSYVSILLDNKVFRMGEDGTFKESASKTDTGAQFLWVSKDLEVTESFRLVSGAATDAAGDAAGDANGVRINLTIVNKSDKEQKIGVRYLFDTWLGEKSNIHFLTNKSTRFDKETQYDKSSMVPYWFSPAETPKDAPKVGLQVLLTGSSVTTPDKVVFANWKRLSDAWWAYTISPTRDFTLRPYSINDSAVCHYYDQKTVPSGGSFEIILVLRNFSEIDVPVTDTQTGNKDTVNKDLQKDVINNMKQDASKDKNTGKDTSKDTAKDKSSASSNKTGNDRLPTVREDLAIIENLMVEINKQLESGKDITDKDIQLLEDILAELKERLKKY